ncbi:serine/arginine repetitive matrix protein 1 isoform X23 [Spodoptera frugiperda]|uniref:Serine/arginine repetitive matrix protein 1 isoform X20 n=1 Tax=Spodoptera frugiperda TaxID=7108 RepID=A0A9R0DCL0_SPOFR|nr:serine/arginine repetitive matrix protein 1 isoform X21 [Spodoptera frugiperda]XP_050552854.1 serine/arginine repetitive matrix protein 1 isoform X20 [Spodoptera frugiperda]XP_050552855.1 serine/arginine repetitive matrix protein 1 isoform X22 [Spodoptera frugiperda]XP_050552856.1 serine/arginine repetitive matrix protein 1 isoform X23 [Spodoptera frugiperda]
MAPPPEYDKEPKAPDKSATNISTEDSKLLHNLVNDQHTNSDHKPTNTAAAVEVENNKHVETLDDGQLRALLDEAITYKCPKDREGKSSLFKELLEEVEQDEQACEAAARTLGARGAGARRGARGRRALPHSNSLQDLVAALAAEPAPRRHHVRHHAPAPAHNVSARAIHGGSLPSGVDTSSLLSEEPARGAGYLATVRCVNPPPLAERRVSASDANTPAEMELLNRRNKPMFPMTYTARATLEIGSGSVCSGRAVTTTTASNQVDSAISFSCITTPEVVSSCNTTSSTAQSAVAVDPKKSLDENGNSVQGFSSPLSGSSQHKKPRRKKSSKNETVIDCQQIDGYQGDKDVNELLRFIESNADNGRGPKLGRVKHKDDSDDKSGKKRSTERRKDKENKIKRATSMEELSRTKIEDLTDATESPLRSDKKERRSDVPNKAERRSWGDDARDSILYNDHPTDSPVAAAELTDFQTVTKKRKPRRRTDEPEPAPRRTRPPSPRPRRESAPPSDRSNDSNDDMDSVHSLPSATPAPPAAPPPTQASYADIARTRHNIPDLIESCNFYGDGAAPPATAPADADGYPALDARQAARRRDKAPPLRRKERAAPPADSAAAEAPAPDVVADRRPAVILLDSGARPRDMDGVTFGFELNEQLLGGGARRPRCELALGALARPRCDLVRDAADAVAVRAGLSALRYVPPATAPDAAALLQIVDYVGAAWDDVLRCGAGKVRYYSE